MNRWQNCLKDLWKIELLRELVLSVAAIMLALLAGGLLVLILGESPLEAYSALWQGSFGSARSLANTLAKATPLIFTGLAVGVAFQCGLFNIGAEGQLYIGAFVSALAALLLPLMPKIIFLPLVVLAGMLAAGLWGAVAGFLKAKFGTHEVIVTVMSNYVAIYLTSYLVNYPFKEPGPVAQTVELPAAASFLKLLPRTQLTTAFVLAVLLAAVVYWLLWYTTLGFQIRAVGENQLAAEAGGVSIMKSMVLAMGISGALAAMGGISQVLGINHRFIDGFSPGYGFTGIAVAVLGRNHPFGIMLTALLFGALDAGALQLNRTTSISAKWVMVIQGLVILFVAAPEIFKFLMKRRVHA
ncbi:ABC transporter permease [Zhaonella formicivorans]|uniref:ABC transporter permease n=1 Tax=Zhaonella formicivorans TaxID=2528593 RepID=UPI0010E04EC9|nr:ABC transporter permease [Zhaonella formicivorans]